MTDDNVAHLAGQAPDDSAEAIAARVRSYLAGDDTELAEAIVQGKTPDLYAVFDDLEVLLYMLERALTTDYHDPPANRITDAYLGICRRQLYIAQAAAGVGGREAAAAEAPQDGTVPRTRTPSATGADDREDTAAGLCKQLAILGNVNGDLLERLEDVDRQTAVIVAEYLSTDAHDSAFLYVDPPPDLDYEQQAADAQAEGKHLVVIASGEGTDRDHFYFVDDATAEALRPLSAGEGGREAAGTR